MVKQLAQVQTKGLKGRVLEFNITETWGDLFYVGLTGIEVLDTASIRGQVKERIWLPSVLK